MIAKLSKNTSSLKPPAITAAMGSHYIPTAATYSPAIANAAMGSHAITTAAVGSHAIPTAAMGSLIIPTATMGFPAIATVVMGSHIIPTAATLDSEVIPHATPNTPAMHESSPSHSIDISLNKL